MGISESPTLKTLLKFIQDSSYRCNLCGEIIYPTITGVDFESESISIATDKHDARGGLGNKILMDNICPECAKRATLFL